MPYIWTSPMISFSLINCVWSDGMQLSRPCLKCLSQFHYLCWGTCLPWENKLIHLMECKDHLKKSSLISFKVILDQPIVSQAPTRWKTNRHKHKKNPDKFNRLDFLIYSQMKTHEWVQLKLEKIPTWPTGLVSNTNAYCYKVCDKYLFCFVGILILSLLFSSTENKCLTCFKWSINN